MRQKERPVESLITNGHEHIRTDEEFRRQVMNKLHKLILWSVQSEPSPSERSPQPPSDPQCDSPSCSQLQEPVAIWGIDPGSHAAIKIQGPHSVTEKSNAMLLLFFVFFLIVARQQCQNITDISNVELIYLEACFLLVHIMVIMAGEDVLLQVSKNRRFTFLLVCCFQETVDLVGTATLSLPPNSSEWTI